MILYIHGFASSGLGAKARTVRAFFGEEAMAPSLSYVPDLAVDTLTQIVETAEKHGEKIGLIGSSLGGFYALWLAERYGLRCVLVNPSLETWKTLAAVRGNAVNYYDGATFEWNDRHVESLKRYAADSTIDRSKILLMLQKGDEVLDYRVALEKLEGASLILEEGGDHSFQGFENHLPKITQFLGAGQLL